jgi:hypothetical protein
VDLGDGGLLNFGTALVVLVPGIYNSADIFDGFEIPLPLVWTTS